MGLKARRDDLFGWFVVLISIATVNAWCIYWTRTMLDAYSAAATALSLAPSGGESMSTRRELAYGEQALEVAQEAQLYAMIGMAFLILLVAYGYKKGGVRLICSAAKAGVIRLR